MDILILENFRYCDKPQKHQTLYLAANPIMRQNDSLTCVGKSVFSECCKRQARSPSDIYLFRQFLLFTDKICVYFCCCFPCTENRQNNQLHFFDADIIYQRAKINFSHGTVPLKWSFL